MFTGGILDGENTWRWYTSGDPISEMEVYRDPPPSDEKCLIALGIETLHDCGCDQLLPFVCEMGNM